MNDRRKAEGGEIFSKLSLPLFLTAAVPVEVTRGPVVEFRRTTSPVAPLGAGIPRGWKRRRFFCFNLQLAVKRFRSHPWEGDGRKRKIEEDREGAGGNKKRQVDKKAVTRRRSPTSQDLRNPKLVPRYLIVRLLAMKKRWISGATAVS